MAKQRKPLAARIDVEGGLSGDRAGVFIKASAISQVQIPALFQIARFFSGS